MSVDTELLFRAAEMSGLERLRLILKTKEDANAQNECGWSLIGLAAHRGRMDLVEFLIDCGANVNVENRLPLNEAIIKRQLSIVKVLVCHGADVDALDKYKMMPLGLAAKCCCIDIVKFLIESKANINAKGKQGNTPLHFAIEGGHIETVKIFIREGADLHARNKRQRTPVEYAINRGYKFISQLLIQHTLLKHPNTEMPNCIHPDSDFFEYWFDCVSEVNKMINFKFGGSKISFQKFLLETNVNKLVGYLSNIKIQTLGELKNICAREFPKYSDLIIEHFKKGKIRECLLHKCGIIVEHSELKKLSVEIIRKITIFLSDEDLENFVKSALY